jgi:hypothetical protein
MCIHPDCKITASYNNEGERKPLYCVTHKKEDMINLINKYKKCIYQDCKIRANYNNRGEKKPLYCVTHKKEDMVDTINKKCIHPDCKKIAIYNNEGDKKPLYCIAHKKEDMVDIINKKCIHHDCKKQPNYNNEGEKKPLYCSNHKKEGMINVTHKMCIHPECKKERIYNNEGKKPLYCSTHKKDGMIDVKNKNCIYPCCKKQPNYNNEEEKQALYCVTHKKDGMVNVKNKTCKSDWCRTQPTEKYDGYCLFCFINLFPDKPVSRNYKTKEYAVVEFVKNKFSNLSWIADKKIQDGCSRRRPDLLLDLGYQLIIIEIDENQHINYDCSCENKRLMQLSQDVDHRPIIFIRFNPDDYKKDGLNITSCWGVNKKGICVVKKSKVNEWVERLNALEEIINYWVDPINNTNKTLEIIQLFYNE